MQVAARRGRAAGRANRAQPARRDRVERVPVAQFAAASEPAIGGATAAAATAAAATSVSTAAATGDPSVSRFVPNPTFDVHGMTAGPLAPASSYTGAEAAAVAPGAPDGSIVGQGGDGGYMDVEGAAAPPDRLESADPLITTDTGVVDRQESDADHRHWARAKHRSGIGTAAGPSSEYAPRADVNPLIVGPQASETSNHGRRMQRSLEWS